mgnify:CR=1 FL=1|tara:strand:+ start:1554 stop:1940 length:387 start_codon:yes stop_codon:yes gene_type:complete
MATIVKNFFNTGSGTTTNLNKQRVKGSSDQGWGILHTPPDGTSTIDEIWMWVDNTHSSYWVQYAIGASSGNAYQNTPCTSAQMKFPTLSPAWLLLSGILIQDNESVVGFRGQYTNYGTAMGYVNRITP